MFTLSGARVLWRYFDSSMSQHIFGVLDAIRLTSEEDGKACGLELLMVYAKAAAAITVGRHHVREPS